MAGMIGRYRTSILAALAIGAGLHVPASANLLSTDGLTPLSSTPPAAPAPVVATIDGEEIRSDDVDLEIPDLNALDGTDRGLLARRALQQIIDRRMLIRALGGPTMRVDPTLSAAARRRQELGFLFTCFKQRAATAPPLTDAEVTAFVTRHPNAFESRRFYRVDQLRLRLAQADLPKLHVLEPDHSLDAVITHLGGLGIAFERTQAVLDTADLSPEIAGEIPALPSGEPFVLRKPGYVMIYAVLGRDPVRETPEQTHRRAVEGARKEREFALFEERIKAESARAKITYQSGYEPQPAASSNP